MASGQAQALCKEWGVDVRQARYSAWGNWYAPITGYPAALIDVNGYLVLDSAESLQLPGIRVTKQINVHNGISSLPGYVWMKRDPTRLPEEVRRTGTFAEGKVTVIEVNKYERDRSARAACIDHHGHACSVCGILLEDVYGADAHAFIHVHHLVSIAAIGKEYRIDPINDLRPVCPNCHAIIHRREPPFGIEELQKLLESNRNG